MAVFPFQYVNRRGIPVLKTTGVTVGTTGVVFSFPNHAFANSWYQGLVLVGHIGKLIKVAGGIMNTHSKWADCRMELFAAAALLAGLPEGKARAFLDCVTTDDALAQCTGEERGLIMDAVMDKIEKYLSYRAPVEMETAAVVFSNVYGMLGKTSQADVILQKSRR